MEKNVDEEIMNKWEALAIFYCILALAIAGIVAAYKAGQDSEPVVDCQNTINEASSFEQPKAERAYWTTTGFTYRADLDNSLEF